MKSSPRSESVRGAALEFHKKLPAVTDENRMLKTHIKDKMIVFFNSEYSLVTIKIYRELVYHKPLEESTPNKT